MERKRMLYKSKVEYMSGDGIYTMNHILGCSHGCKYPCYAFTAAKRYGQVETAASIGIAVLLPLEGGKK